MIFANPDIAARPDRGATLTYDYLTRCDGGAVGALHPEIFRIRIAQVLCRPGCFCCGHCVACSVELIACRKSPKTRYDSSVRIVQDSTLRIKALLEQHAFTWGIPIIVVGVGFASFGLGRLSTMDGARPAVTIREVSLTTDTRPLTPGGLVVASRKGSTYHFPWCPGAESIHEANKIWFASEEEARSRGYTPAKNCTGLGGVQ